MGTTAYVCEWKRRQRGARRALGLSAIASAADYRAALEAATPEVRATVAAILDGSMAPPAPLSREPRPPKPRKPRPVTAKPPKPPKPPKVLRQSEAQRIRDMRRRHVRMALGLGTLAPAAAFEEALAAATPEMRELVADILSGAKMYSPPARVSQSKFKPAPGESREERAAAAARRDAYLAEVGGMWPERARKRPEGVAVYQGRPPVERSAPAGSEGLPPRKARPEACLGPEIGLHPSNSEKACAAGPGPAPSA